jgi:hypothetical protein
MCREPYPFTVEPKRPIWSNAAEWFPGRLRGTLVVIAGLGC